MNPIFTDKAPEPVGPYSQAVKVGNFIFVSGQVPINPETGKLVQSTIKEQTLQVFKNIQSVLNKAKLDLKDIVKVEIYLININDFKELNQVYSSIFTKPYPARQVIGASKLPFNSKIEISCIAYKN